MPQTGKARRTLRAPTSAGVVAPEALRGEEWAAIAAILDGDLAWTALPDLPGGGAMAGHLAGAGWVETWDLDDGPHATLTPWAAERLGVAMAERVVSVWRVESWEGFDGEETGTTRISRPAIEEMPRWEPPGAPTRSTVQPRNRGFAPLPFPDRVPEPGPEPGPEPPGLPEISDDRVAELVLLGQVVRQFRPRPRSRKKRRKSA